jgi:hypothetical protein
VIIVGIFVAHETQVRNCLVVASLVDGERRRKQPLIDGL